MNSSSDLTCPGCQHKGVWQTYFCPGCDDHWDQLYRDEHRDQERARFMNRADILEEYHMAGIPFRPGVGGL